LRENSANGSQGLFAKKRHPKPLPRHQLEAGASNMDSSIITAPLGEFCRLAGFGRSRVYELIDAGELDSVLIGRRRLIIIESYRQLIERRKVEGQKLPRPGAKKG
jgi:hypothetical protein